MSAPEIEILLVGPRELAKYVAVPMRFVVTERVVPEGPPYTHPLPTRPVPDAYVKKYAPGCVAEQVADLRAFGDDTAGHFLASAGDRVIGGASALYACADYQLLGGRNDLATLRDLRVDPSWRRRGVAQLLLERVVAWALRKGLRELQIETQDINVPACRLYESTGFTLREVRHGAYAEYPDELQLLWYLELLPRPSV